MPLIGNHSAKVEILQMKIELIKPCIENAKIVNDLAEITLLSADSLLLYQELISELEEYVPVEVLLAERAEILGECANLLTFRASVLAQIAKAAKVFTFKIFAECDTENRLVDLLVQKINPLIEKMDSVAEKAKLLNEKAAEKRCNAVTPNAERIEALSGTARLLIEQSNMVAEKADMVNQKILLGAEKDDWTNENYKLIAARAQLSATKTEFFVEMAKQHIGYVNILIACAGENANRAFTAFKLIALIGNNNKSEYKIEIEQAINRIGEAISQLKIEQAKQNIV